MSLNSVLDRGVVEFVVRVAVLFTFADGEHSVHRCVDRVGGASRLITGLQVS